MFITPLVVAFSGSLIVATISVGGLTAAMTALWAAITGPIGITIIAIGALTAAIVGLSEAWGDNRTEAEKTVDLYDELSKNTEKTAKETK